MTETAVRTEYMVKTWRARRRLKVRAGTFREPGELFPEAHIVRLAESWEHQGRARRTEVPESEFRSFVEENVTDAAQRELIYDKVGLNPEVVTRGNHHAVGPKVPTKTVKQTPTDTPKSHRVGGPVKKATPPPATHRVPRGTVKAGGGQPAAKRTSIKNAQSQDTKLPVPTEARELAVTKEVHGGLDIPMRSLLDDVE